MDMLGAGMSVAVSVAGVLSAFQDADTLIQRVKVRRVSRFLPLPPETLEETIAQAPEEIARAKRRGVERFGKPFEDGDYPAVVTIQQITIQLQNGLLQRLRSALEQDEGTDFFAMADLADSARDGTVTALTSLRQRLMQPAGSMQIPTLVEPPHSVATSRRSSTAPTIPVKDVRRQPQAWVDPYISGAGKSWTPAADNDQQASTRRSSSVFGLIKRNATRATSEDHVQRLDAPTSLRPSASFSSHMRSNSHSGQVGAPARGFNEGSPFTFRDVGNNNFEIWAPDPTGYSKFGTDAQSTFSERSRTNSIISTQASTAPTVSTRLSNAQRGPRMLLATPTPENDYLGFCKGAWKAQNDDPKAMIERRDFAQTAQSQMSFPSCSKCAFKGHIESRRIWNRVVVDEMRGIKYRWSFLAKSHVNRKAVRERNYAYQCIFCVFMGLKEQIIYTEDTYLDHVSQHHRMEMLDDVILDRTRCINDRVCQNNERFDINLLPVMSVASPRKSFPAYEQLAYDMKAFELAA